MQKAPSMQQQVDEQTQDRKWLSLGLARRLLDINEATLRQWADNGLVQTFRTPGGHRRFSSEDIHALIENRQRQVAGRPGRSLSTSTALPRIRKKLTGSKAGPPEWHGQFEATGLERMRGLGRELLELCQEALGQSRQAEVLAQARTLGARYGQEVAQQGVLLSDAVQAFTFFRGALVEALRPALLRHSLSTYELAQHWQQLGRITDEVLLAMTRSYPPSQEPQSAVTA